MSWSDAGLLALRSLGRRGARSLLACLGVALGTTLLVALLSISGGADTRIVSQLSHGGPAAAIHVKNALPDPAGYDSDVLQAGPEHDLTDDSLRLIRSSPHVSSIVPVLASGALVVPCPGIERAAPDATPACRQHTDTYFGTLIGADLRHVNDLPITLLAGRLPRVDSMDEVAVTAGYVERVRLDVNRPAQVLGSEIEFATPQLLPGNGPTRFRGRWYIARVVGVVAQTVDDGEFLTPIQQTQAARRWALAGVDGRNFTRPVSPYSGAVVVADTLADVHSVRREIFDLGYANSAPEHLVASIQKYLHVVDIVLGGIGGVALAIAVLGVANTLLAAVRERWREIGVLKALGADDGDVARWFLIEAGLLGVVGGLLGTAAGTAVTGLVALLVDRYLREQGLYGLDLGGLPLPIVVGAPIATAVLAVAAGV
ncbi:MAG TPA: ABC transporter permease, partial [Candidatus Dormibacteraeota bacterium]|nr:ABC transporter permease [Candidatus Dormibacteraeota bacterium]